MAKKNAVYITQEARELLAEAYRQANKPWFVNTVLNEEHGQFNVSLGVITKLLEPKKYCRYDLPGVNDIDENCTCEWCKKN